MTSEAPEAGWACAVNGFRARTWSNERGTYLYVRGPDGHHLLTVGIHRVAREPPEWWVTRCDADGTQAVALDARSAELAALGIFLEVATEGARDA